jgi:hypothetical protein
LGLYLLAIFFLEIPSGDLDEPGELLHLKSIVFLPRDQHPNPLSFCTVFFACQVTLKSG